MHAQLQCFGIPHRNGTNPSGMTFETYVCNSKNDGMEELLHHPQIEHCFDTSVPSCAHETFEEARRKVYAFRQCNCEKFRNAASSNKGLRQVWGSVAGVLVAAYALS